MGLRKKFYPNQPDNTSFFFKVLYLSLRVSDARGRNFGAYSYLVDSAGKRTDSCHDSEHPDFGIASSA